MCVPFEVSIHSSDYQKYNVLALSYVRNAQIRRFTHIIKEINIDNNNSNLLSKCHTPKKKIIWDLRMIHEAPMICITNTLHALYYYFCRWIFCVVHIFFQMHSLKSIESTKPSFHSHWFTQIIINGIILSSGLLLFVSLLSRFINNFTMPTRSPLLCQWSFWNVQLCKSCI